MQSLNPGVGFEAGDVNRIAMIPVASSEQIDETVAEAFREHESHREASFDFVRPGPSTWLYAQAWAQEGVDRPEGAPLPAYLPESAPPPPIDYVSFAVGIALGRFGGDGESVLEDAPPFALPNGILFVSSEAADSLDQPACVSLHGTWTQQGSTVGDGDDFGTYLRKSFFDFHKKLYER